MTINSRLFFNEAFYRAQNPDVANVVDNRIPQAGGFVYTSVRQHFDLYGAAEGRAATPLFNVEAYRANNPDLAEAGLTTDAQLRAHWNQYGAAEGRNGFTAQVFNLEFYKAQNADLVAAGLTDAQITRHFVEFGALEGRLGSPAFDVTAYKTANPDLASLPDAVARAHWYGWGVQEGRAFPQFTQTFTLSQGALTVTEGSSITYTVTVDRPSLVDVVVPVTVTTGSGGTAADVTAPVNVVIPAGATSATFVVRANDDSVSDNGETFTVGLGGVGAMVPTQTAVILDRAPASVTISGPAEGVTEGGNLLYTVTLSRAVNVDTVLNYTVSGTATSGSDFTALTNSIRIPAGQTSGVITVMTTNDTLTEQSETVTITLASTNGTVIAGATLSATGTILDNDNVAPVFTSEAMFSVSENGTAAFTAVATDGNAMDGDVVSYSLSGADAALFTVDAMTGAVSFVSAPDFEAPADAGMDNVYNVTVTASDTFGGMTTQDVAVTVTNVNEAPTVMATASVTAAENGTGVVVTATTTDPDAGDTVTYSLTGADAALFTINAMGEVSFVMGPDFEAPGSAAMSNDYAINVVATDGGMLTSTTAVTVTVTDVNDSAPAITAGQTGTVAENAAAGAAVATVMVTDADVAAMNPANTFSITAGNDAMLFAIDAATGAITVAAGAMIDFETVMAVELTVQVSDGVNAATTGMVTVNVTDVNDNAPIITAAQTGMIAENSAAGTVVATVMTTDADATAGVNPATMFSITAGNDAMLFAIDAATGAITVATGAMIDFETVMAVTLTVQADDGVNMATTETVAISVTDVNEAPSLTITGTASVSQGVESSLVMSAVATDADGNWNGGMLTVQVTGNYNPGDVADATDGDGITVGGTLVTNAGGFLQVDNDGLAGGATTVIGTITNSGRAEVANATTAPVFTVAFNANATNALVQRAIEGLRLQTATDQATTTARTLTYTLTDSAGLSASTTSTATIASTNTPAFADLNGDTLIYTAGAAAALIDQGMAATVDDTDVAAAATGGYTGGTLRISITSGAAGNETLAVAAGTVTNAGGFLVVGGSTIGQITGTGANGTDLVISLTANATDNAISTILQNITFAATTVGNRTLSVTVSDLNGSNTSTAATVNVTVPSAAQTLSLTDGDNLMGTAAVDLFNATTVNSLQGNDTVNGEAGSDILRATLNGANITPTVTNVERIELVLETGGSTFSTMNVTFTDTTQKATIAVSGNQTLALNDLAQSIGTIDGSAATAAITATFAMGAETVTVTGGTAADTFAFGDFYNAGNVIMGGDAAMGGALDDILTLNVANAAALMLNTDGVEDIRLALATSVTSASLDASTIVSAANVAIRVDAGASASAFTISNLSDAVTSVDGMTGTYLGGLNITLTNNSDITVAGGAGTDSITAGTITARDTFDGEGGTSDTLMATVNGLGSSTTAVMLDITQFEGVTLTTGAAASFIDFTNVTSADAAGTLTVNGASAFTATAVGNTWTMVSAADLGASFAITFAAAADVSVTGSMNADTFTFGSTLDQMDTVNGGEGADTLTATVDTTAASLDFTAGMTGLLQISSVETVSIANAGSANALTIDASGLSGTTTLNIVRQNATTATTRDTTINNIASTLTTISAGGTLTNGNAGVTGALNLNLFNAGNHTITGGGGGDTFDFADGTMAGTLADGDVIDGGAGADTVTSNLTGGTILTNALVIMNVETVTLTHIGGTAAATETLTINAGGITGTGVTLTLDANGTADSSFVVTNATTTVTTSNSNASDMFSITAAAGTTAVTFTGGDGADTLTGADGADNLMGGAAADVLTGGAGADTLTGGTGVDTLSGGTGADVFSYAVGDTGATSVTRDVITDFNSEEDFIDLTAYGNAVSRAYTFIGSGVTPTARTVQVTPSGSSNALVSIYDGTGVLTAQILLQNVNAASLTASNFLLVGTHDADGDALGTLAATMSYLGDVGSNTFTAAMGSSLAADTTVAGGQGSDTLVFTLFDDAPDFTATTGIDRISIADATPMQTLTITDALVTASDSMVVTVLNTGGGNLTVNSAGVTTSGNSVSLGSAAQYTLAGASTVSVANVNATVSLAANGTAQTLTGGTGMETVIVGAAAHFVDKVVMLGTGTDTLQVGTASQTFSNASVGATATGVDVIQFTDTSAHVFQVDGANIRGLISGSDAMSVEVQTAHTAITVNTSGLNGVGTVVAGAMNDGTAVTTLTIAGANSNVTLKDGLTFTVALAAAGTTQTVTGGNGNVTYTATAFGDFADKAIVAGAGMDTLQIGDATATVTSATFANKTGIDIISLSNAGGHSVSFGSDGASLVQNSDAMSVTIQFAAGTNTLDTSAVSSTTHGVVLAGDATTVTNLMLTGQISTNNFASSITSNGGAGSTTTVTTGTGVDAYTGSAANDILVYTTLTGSTSAALDTVAQFTTAGTDQIDLRAVVTAANFNTTVVNLSTAASAAAAAEIFALSVGAGKGGAFLHGGNTYLFVNDGSTTFNANDDLLIQLTTYTGAINGQNVLLG